MFQQRKVTNRVHPIDIAVHLVAFTSPSDKRLCPHQHPITNVIDVCAVARRDKIPETHNHIYKLCQLRQTFIEKISAYFPRLNHHTRYQ